MNETAAKKMMNPMSLSIDDLAAMLHASAHTIRSHVETGGAPSNPDGTMNIAHYTAWMVGEVG